MNLAYKRVKSNNGSGGIDKMDVESLRDYLVANKEELIQSISDGTYRPNPVRRVEILIDRIFDAQTIADMIFQQDRRNHLIYSIISESSSLKEELY